MRAYNHDPVYHLFTGIGSGGNSDSFVWPGGPGVWKINGTFNSSVATLKVLSDDGTYIPYGDGSSQTTAAAIEFDGFAGDTFRVEVTGGTPTGMTSSLRG